MHNNVDMYPQVVAKILQQKTDFIQYIQSQEPDVRELVSGQLLEAYIKFINFIHKRGDCADDNR